MTKEQQSMRLLSVVHGALDRLIAAGKPYEGFFPSLLNRQTGEMLLHLPPEIPGQRKHDRSHLGSNLIHEEPTLRTLYALDRPDYKEAAERYLKRFATVCTHTVSGLFPWGEHSFWHLIENKVGNSYLNDPKRHPSTWANHDHLRDAPLWLWEKLWEFNPKCVERFAEGLEYHWKEGPPFEYIRHGWIDKRMHPPADPEISSCDFPRHGGFYIFDWSFAWEKTGRPDFLQQIKRMLDYWWDKRDDRNLLLLQTRFNKGDLVVNAPGQTLSLAMSLLESAGILEAKLPDLAETMRVRAQAYIDGFLAAPHDVENRIFVIQSLPEDNRVERCMPVWGSEYGVWPVGYVALTCLCAYRLTGREDVLHWAKMAGSAYLSEPFPEDVHVPAMDAGLALGLLADLYDITGDEEWLKGAFHLADRLVEEYFDEALPRGASGIDWYESQMGPGFLIHALARTALLAKDRENCKLSADYTAR